ncbi:MAG: hypothetical protein N3G19_00855 [Candidatus Pacearchaeota archaeon]|nr:hypothetical protein [Candidatus Pacearchaeota archaeon]
MNLNKKIEEFFEISGNVNFSSVIPYLGSAALSFYNIVDGNNNYDGLLNGIALASLIFGFCVSGISYLIYKKIEQNPEEVDELEETTSNGLIRNAIAYYKKRKGEK